MTFLKWLAAAAAAFGGFVTLMYLTQRALMYHPETFGRGKTDRVRVE